MQLLLRPDSRGPAAQPTGETITGTSAQWGPWGRWLLSATVLRGIVTCAPQLEEEKHSYQATGLLKISGPDPPSAASSHWTASESHLETRCLDTSVCYGDGHL